MAFPIIAPSHAALFMDVVSMTVVITYGTYDLLHQGHINLLKRAKELGDYLIVGVTSEDFDLNRGKINVQQTLVERIKAVQDTGYADLVIPEEYVGQKIDDIRRYEADVFAIGSDWRGHFDYLESYCDVVYLDRTKGISSTELREEANHIRMGIVGDSDDIQKFISESHHVTGIDASLIWLGHPGRQIGHYDGLTICDSLDELLDGVDAVYVANRPSERARVSAVCLERGKHVLCESPIAFSGEEARKLFELAESRGLVLFEAIKTAYALAFSRLKLLVESRRIGDVRSVDARCTSMAKQAVDGSMVCWGPIAALGVFSILGEDYQQVSASTVRNLDSGRDAFTKINFQYPGSVASLTVANGAKSEGDLVVAGTEGYIYVPSPWWKTDYFEVRKENPSENKRYFYQLDGEGIRFEISAFSRAVLSERRENFHIRRATTEAIAELVGGFQEGRIPTFEMR